MPARVIVRRRSQEGVRVATTTGRIASKECWIYGRDLNVLWQVLVVPDGTGVRMRGLRSADRWFKEGGT